jgi:Na+-translocating ferredoxin:NAD+ oxidoreductase RnfA subunit
MVRMIGSLAALMFGLLIVIVAGLYSSVVMVNWPVSWPGALLVGIVALVGLMLAFFGGRGLWKRMAHGAN